MITFGLNIAAEALPAAALNADAAQGGALGAEAFDFSNLLQGLMGAPSGARPAVDLPLDRDGGDAAVDDEEVGELVNAIVVDLGAPPVLRLTATTVWAVTETAAMPAMPTMPGMPAMPAMPTMPAMATMPAMPGMPAIDVSALQASMADSPVSAAPASPAGDSVDLPTPVPDAPAIPVETLVTAKAKAAVETPASPNAPAREGAPAPNTSGREGAPAATANTPAAKAERAVVPPPADVAPSPAPANAETSPVPPEPQRELPAASSPAARATDKHDAARHTLRMTADAGQRAYVAAASEAPAKDTQQGYGDARHEQRAELEPVSAAPNTTAAVPFQVVAERPAPVVGAVLATPVVMAAEAVEVTVAAELPAQVVQSIRLQAIDGGGEAIVRLRPDYLGELVVAVKVENGAVSAALQSDTPAVRKWVESNEASLRQALAEHGLQLDRLTVSDEAPPAESGERDRQERPRDEEETQPEGRRQRKPAPDATFEVIV